MPAPRLEVVGNVRDGSRGNHTIVMEQQSTEKRRLTNLHVKTLKWISLALGQKDGYTQAHGYRVARYAMRLAWRMGFSAQSVRQVGVGGLFHDAGKLALNDRIFTGDQTDLSNDLLQEVHCHPLIGAALLKHIDFLDPIIDFVLFHHEREDGTGYPFGLKGKEIPPGAKIISIADCFDAVITDRPYQKGKSIDSAYEILRKGCHHDYCEQYVEVFIEEIMENGIIRDTVPDPRMVEKLVMSLVEEKIG